jgi:hypothetical protein
MRFSRTGWTKTGNLRNNIADGSLLKQAAVFLAKIAKKRYAQS